MFFSPFVLHTALLCMQCKINSERCHVVDNHNLVVLVDFDLGLRNMKIIQILDL